MCDYSQFVLTKIELPYDLKKKIYADINSQLQHKDYKMIGHNSFADRN
jgi:hypothetical protein